ncbi:MAG: glycogen/starch/alpha-glucan family phosphorylase [Chitinispirillaceae bacterium]|nr:glycogen/starch/alpha-glucan family phosphorylase [Chitinispirillaceae bacterium]
MDGKILRDAFYRYLTNFLGKDEATATVHDRYMALAYAVRSEFMKNWIATQKRYHQQNLRRVYYLSTEYILGKSLFQNIMNHGIEQEMAHAVKSLGFSIDTVYEQEDDFMLGNGSEARLAACLLEAMASHGFPAMAYGLRYEYGLFRQEIRNGVQIERPNDWLRRGNPWEIERPEYCHTVQFGGECRARADNIYGAYEWRNTESVLAIPYDVPIVGFRNGTVNTLRLWSARATEEFLPDYLNHRDYERAYLDKSKLSDITELLFPDEDVRRATDLRMRQQYFFISASLQDILRRFKRDNNTIEDFDKKVVIHLGGSRCALAIPELMRLLVDHEGVPWENAWGITKNVFSYTSHAVLREDAEVWPVYKVGQLLPRHLQVIFDINQIHLDDVRKKHGNESNLVRELSLVEEGEVKRIRFADMAVLGSFSVNGVSREQTAILRTKVFPTFARYFADRFSCTVNGISLRRWLLNVNRPLGLHIIKHIGDRWIRTPEQLVQLEKMVDDDRFLQGLHDIKMAAKSRLAGQLRSSLGLSVDPSMAFDVHMGKMHGSKRQLLHLLYVLHCYLCVKRGREPPGGGRTRRLHLFSGKASPSDFLAKQILHLIILVADRINNDPQAGGLMQVVMIPDFSLSLAESITPAVDISEQLATAGLEPSGTFAMKLAANGAITIASRGGAAVEFAETVGNDYILTFGKTGEEISLLNGYRPSDLLSKDERLQAIFDFLENDLIPSAEEGHAMYPLLSSLRDSDRQFVLLDFSDYAAKNETIDTWYNDRTTWCKKTLMNIARSGWFSIDRAVREYAGSIWKISGT